MTDTFSVTLAFCAGLLVSFVFFAIRKGTVAPKEGSELDLAIGYDLLLSTLKDEVNLGKLLLVKYLTFSAPKLRIERIMKEINERSKIAVRDLKPLLKKEPVILSPPAGANFGVALRENIKGWSKKHLLSRTKAFDVRFLALQAQAMVMIRGVASELEKIDPATERQVFLSELARDYRQFRIEIIALLELAKSAEL